MCIYVCVYKNVVVAVIVDVAVAIAIVAVALLCCLGDGIAWSSVCFLPSRYQVRYVNVNINVPMDPNTHGQH